ncbi:acyl carrier protein [Pseudomonas sp. 15FMM2]|uniref:Acyl carrier protein n=1 Tax=Pseudomonas imrae TaxID=2992837 RepID=A0ACC7PLY4_9PSED
MCSGCSFFDSGANSLGAIKLVALLNRLAGYEFISLGQFHQLPTLGDLARRLTNHPDLAGVVIAGRERYYFIALEQGEDHG